MKVSVVVRYGTAFAPSTPRVVAIFESPAEARACRDRLIEDTGEQVALYLDVTVVSASKTGSDFVDPT